MSNTSNSNTNTNSMSSNTNTSQSFQLGNYNFNSEADFQAWLNDTVEQDRRLDSEAASTSDPGAAATAAAADDDTDTDSVFGDSSSSSSSASDSTIHEPESEEGVLILQRIRAAFFMAPTTPFEQVRHFLECNPDVIRHLARQTIPNPDHFVGDERTSRLHEPVLAGDRAVAAVGILFDIKEVNWRSAAIDIAVDVAMDPDREAKVLYTDVLRKYRTGKRTKRAREWLRRNDKQYRAWDDQRTARQRMERMRPRRKSTILSKEVYFSSSDSDCSGGAAL